VTAELSGTSGAGVTAATGGAVLIAGTAGEDVEVLIAGGGDASARSIAGRKGGASAGAATGRAEGNAGRRGDGTDARVGGREIVFCREGDATATSTFSGFSAATLSVATTVAVGFSVAPVVDAATGESRTTSACDFHTT
jgi:hypothetical protein